MELKEGSQIAGYRVEKYLGSGGLGEVYLSTQLSMDRNVALKVLPPAISEDKELIQAFLREARLLAKLEHPNIVTAFDVGEEEGLYYLAMSYVKGEDLAQRLDRKGPIPENEALGIALKLARALSYAWKNHRIIHHDIKPANIMIDAEGEVKLLDMGLSRQMYRDSRVAPSDTFEGTPNYVSPEQAAGRTVADCRSDIYSLGVTLHHVLTGKLPYQNLSPAEILTQGVLQPLPSARKLNPRISPECAELLDAMMAKDPLQRPRNWDELIDRIRHVQAAKAVKPKAVKKNLPRSTRPPAKAHRAKAGAVKKPSVPPVIPAPVGLVKKKRIPFNMISLSVIVILGGSYGCWQWQANRQSRTSQEHREATRRVEIAARKESLAEKKYQEVALFIQQRPREKSEALRRLQGIEQAVRGTKYGPIVQAEMRRLRKEVKNRRPETGESAWERKQRLEAEEKVRARAQRNFELFQTEQPDLYSALADHLLNQDVEPALRRTSEALEEFTGEFVAAELLPIRNGLETMAGLPQQVLDTFKGDIGKEVPVALVTGTEELKIKKVEPTVVRAERLLRKSGEVVAAASRDFGYRELSPDEKRRKLDRLNTPESRVLCGVIAFLEGEPATAKRYLASSTSPLSDILLDRLSL